MKILFLGDIFHPNSRNWIAALRTCKGLEVFEWSLPPAESVWEKTIRWKERLIAAYTLKDEIRKFSPDLLIAYRSSGYGILGALSGFHPFVVAGQGETDAWPLDHWSAPLKERVISFVLSKADLVHAWGQNMADEFIKLGADKRKLFILPRGVPDEFFLRGSLSRASDEFRLITTRSLRKEYGHAKILTGVSHAITAGLNVKLSVAGKGPLINELKHLADELNICDQVLFTGFLHNGRLVHFLKESNIYISMPETEGVSASLFEAMASGNFPIVSRIKAYSQFIKDGVNGFMLDPDDKAGLFRCLQYLSTHKDFWEEAIQHNRLLAERVGSDAVNVPKFITRYEKLLEERSTSKCGASS